MGVLLWERMEMGEDGCPQGVRGLTVAIGVKPGRDWSPVPPITAILMGSDSMLER
jgi:hypothetical protein